MVYRDQCVFISNSITVLVFGTFKKRVYLLKFFSEFRLIISMYVGENLKTLSLAPLSGLRYKGNKIEARIRHEKKIRAIWG